MLLLGVHLQGCPGHRQLLHAGPNLTIARDPVQSKAIPTLWPFLSGHKHSFFFCLYIDIENVYLVKSQ